MKLLSVTFNDATPTWFEFVIFPLDFPGSRVTSALSSPGDLSNFGYSSIFTGHNALACSQKAHDLQHLAVCNQCIFYICMYVCIFIYFLIYYGHGVGKSLRKPWQKTTLFIYPSIIYIYIYSFICLCMPINKFID